MPINPIQFTQTLTIGGGTVNIDVNEIVTEYILNGTGTLSSNWTIQPSATPTKTCLVRIFYNCTFALNGNTITVFGNNINVQQALSGNILIEASYDFSASVWVVIVKESDSELIPEVQGVKTTTLTAGGGTITLTPGIDNVWQELVGNATLLASWAVTAPSTPGYFYVHYSGTLTPNGNNVSIFGTTLTDSQIVNGSIIVLAYYDVANAVWRSQLVAQPNDVDYKGTTTTDISAGATVTLQDGPSTQVQVLIGNGILGGAVLVNSTGTFKDGQSFKILYQATTSGSSVDILGYTLTAAQQLYGNLEVEAIYKLATTSWILVISQAPNETIGGQQEVIIIPVSFEAGEQCNNTIYITFPCTIDQVFILVTKVIAATDAATITVKINGTSVGGANPASIPLSSALNYNQANGFATPNTVTTSSYIDIISAKTTPGGKALVTLFVTRTP